MEIFTLKMLLHYYCFRNLILFCLSFIVLNIWRSTEGIEKKQGGLLSSWNELKCFHLPDAEQKEGVSQLLCVSISGQTFLTHQIRSDLTHLLKFQVKDNPLLTSETVLCSL